MNSASILVVEDDENLRISLVDNLELEGYRVQSSASIEQSRRVLRADSYDLLILDLMLPDGDGYSLCRELRGEGVLTPVLMLTARSLEDDLLSGFEAGADDYLTKPFRLRELLARVKALLRRRGMSVNDVHQLGDLTIHLHSRTVHRANSEPIELTRKEFDLLVFLAQNRDVAMSRDRIIDEVWGVGVIVDVRTVDNFVSSLKRKLNWSAHSSFQIATVRGVGYRMEAGALPQ